MANVSSVSAIGFSGGVPAFPSTDTLEAGTFKVVVGSWRRINPATTPTSDFTVDVSTYAPKTPFVERVTLVDVDIPHTQQLIEAAWSRVYYQQGVPVSPTCRSLEVVTDGVVNTVVLPLTIDRVKSFQRMQGGVTRLFMTHRAPAPISSIAELWRCIPGGLGLRLCGVPGFYDGFLLTPDNVSMADTGTMALDVVSYDLAEAIDGVDASFALYLWSGPIPGPSYLAAILTKACTDLLLDSCVTPLCESCESPPINWQFQFTYSTTDDKFSLYAKVPRFVHEVSIGGQLSEYMGFGTRAPVHTSQYDTRAILTPSLNIRMHPREAYARLNNDSPRCAEEIARALQWSFNTYEWQEFCFGLQFPGAEEEVVNVCGGRMTLRQLAEAITAITFPRLKICVTYITTESGDKSGLKFENADGNVFHINWLLDERFSPHLVGYERRILPAARSHYPTRTAVHIPLPNGCAPPASDIWVIYNNDTQQILLQSVPFKIFKAQFFGVDTTDFNLLRISTDNVCRYAHGLQPGARVIIVDSTNRQHISLVVEVESLTTFTVLMYDRLCSDDNCVTVVPQDRMPIDLYFQVTPTREKSLFSTLIGFQPITYEAWSEITSPGTVDIRQDPYLLLCLSFQAEDSSCQTGNVYYPFETNSQIIFGKILKSACTFRAEYDRWFSHDFKGTGIHLGYIRVRILNSDGTLYESHGHPISVCLKFDVRQSGVGLGGPGAILQLPAQPPVRR